MKAELTQKNDPVVSSTIFRLAFVSGALLTCMFLIVKLFSSAMQMIS